MNCQSLKNPPIKRLLKTKECLLRGDVVALPTDTIYGVACLAQNSQAVNKVYELKERDSNKPIAICLSNVSLIKNWCYVTVPDALLEELLPGAVTVVLPRRESLNPQLNPHMNSVGVRVPKHDIINQLCALVGDDQPLALTSANLSGEPSCLQCEEFQHLHRHLGDVLDVGPLTVDDACRAGSTVVDLTSAADNQKFHIVRKGCAYDSTIAVLIRHGFTAD